VITLENLVNKGELNGLIRDVEEDGGKKESESADKLSLRRIQECHNGRYSSSQLSDPSLHIESNPPQQQQKQQQQQLTTYIPHQKVNENIGDNDLSNQEDLSNIEFSSQSPHPSSQIFLHPSLFTSYPPISRNNCSIFGSLRMIDELVWDYEVNQYETKERDGSKQDLEMILPFQNGNMFTDHGQIGSEKVSNLWVRCGLSQNSRLCELVEELDDSNLISNNEKNEEENQLITPIQQFEDKYNRYQDYLKIKQKNNNREKLGDGSPVIKKKRIEEERPIGKNMINHMKEWSYSIHFTTNAIGIEFLQTKFCCISID